MQAFFFPSLPLCSLRWLAFIKRRQFPSSLSLHILSSFLFVMVLAGPPHLSMISVPINLGAKDYPPSLPDEQGLVSGFFPNAVFSRHVGGLFASGQASAVFTFLSALSLFVFSSPCAF